MRERSVQGCIYSVFLKALAAGSLARPLGSRRGRRSYSVAVSRGADTRDGSFVYERWISNPKLADIAHRTGRDFLRYFRPE